MTFTKEDVAKFWDDHTTIVEVGPFRHMVKFDDRDEPSSITGCNFCGGVFCIKNGNGVFCSECGATMDSPSGAAIDDGSAEAEALRWAFESGIRSQDEPHD